MENVKVSVIIPVYNAEQYLKECLESVVHQTLQEIEIICVNDGSKDDSISILEAYASEDSRIRVVSQKNSGAGIARNNGIKMSSGEYIAFLDSDDWFEPDALEKMYLQATKDEAEVCVCGRTDHVELFDHTASYDVLISARRVPREMPFNMKSNPDYILNFTNGAVWNKLFRRSFVEENRIAFSEAKRGEDVCFTTLSLCLAERITILNEPLIHYRVHRVESLTSTAYQDPGEVVENWRILVRDLKDRGIYPKRSMANRMWGFMLRVIQQIRWPDYEILYDRIKTEVLPEAGIKLQEPGYYYRAWQEEMLKHLNRENAGEFLLSYLNVMETRLLEAKELKQAQAEKYTAKINRLQTRIGEQKERLSSQAAQLKAVKAENKAIKDSVSYKIGRAVTLLPRKIKGLFHR